MVRHRQNVEDLNLEYRHDLLENISGLLKLLQLLVGKAFQERELRSSVGSNEYPSALGLTW